MYICKKKDMRIFTEQTIKEYAEKHPDSLAALQDWVSVVKKSNWTCFADIKRTFNSVDAIGSQRYVFNYNPQNEMYTFLQSNCTFFAHLIAV